MFRPSSKYDWGAEPWRHPGDLLPVVLMLLLILSSCNIMPEAVRQDRKTAKTAKTATTAVAEGAEQTTTARPVQLPPPRLRIADITPTGEVHTAGRPQYKLDVRVDYDRHTVQVTEIISGQLPAAETLSELVLVVEPERGNGVFVLNTIAWADGDNIEQFELKDGLLHIPLEQALLAEEPFQLKIIYQLKLPLAASYLGYTSRQLNLGDWYPFIPAYQDGKGWLVHDPSPVGEHLVYPASDYMVSLAFESTGQKKLVVAASAPGKLEYGGYSFNLEGGRGFAISVSPDYQVIAGEDGVSAYVFPEHRLAGEASLNAVQQALKLFSDIYAPYPYPGLSIVEGDLFDGMEYSGLFFLGADYFTQYPGQPISYLVPLSVHETAHQWWYGLVGNDPASEPWLDEALCTYSELLFYQKYHPNLVDWWWSFRVGRFDPQGKVDISIYDKPSFRPYVDAVYLRGSLFLDGLRKRIGEDAFRALLKDYARQNAGTVAIRSDFFEAVRRSSDLDISDLLEEYFR